MFQVKTSAHLLKFTAEMAVRLSSFHRISWWTDLPHQTPGEAQHFCLTGCCPNQMLHSLWSCTLVNAKWRSFSSSQVACAQVSPVERLSTKTVAQGIQLCQEGEETLEGSLVRCWGSSSSSRKRRVYYTGLLCSLAHARKESQQDFCYWIPWEHLKFLPDVVC